MRHPGHPFIATAGLCAVTLIGLAGCSGDGMDSSITVPARGGSAARPNAPTSTTSVAAPGLVGSGCQQYSQQVPDGPGSVPGMAAEPVALAAANNPMLTTLAAALTGRLNPKVKLAATLNSGQYTVFAPTDDAFKKLPTSTFDALRTDSATLTRILLYHVVQGQLSPESVVGSHPTLESSALQVTDTGAGLKVNDAALVCGGIKTADATVYMIDKVLVPQTP